ncbi:hypothetical protein Bca52824_083928 [Brassica carinata]|uniref:Helicase ATP-binding domain-containing protein n=1 Tax=Brassica carinata TaxID=52824 RepID=A0A8X7PMN1_BRACI|nr:hypothetical protein Bca52824_083928 [Brassica carinata]
MNTLPVVSLLTPSSFKFFHFPSPLSPSPTFRFTKPLILPSSQLSFKSLNSLSPSQSQLSEDYEEDEDEDEEEDEDDDGDDEAADEYDDITDEARNTDDDEEAEFPVDSPPESSRQRVELRWQRVEKLRSLVRDFGVEMIDIDELVSIYDFRIDKFQRLAIEAFLRGSSVVVSAPTSSGKTLIAEAAAVATVARGRRLFYTTPLKALSNQKFREFRETFGDDNVGLLTGDSAINKDAQIVIMTTEILRNMLYQSVGMASSGTGLFHVDAIVLDEVHYLSDISRGTVWEEIVIYCPKEVQLICLSATVANPDELAGWIGEIHGKTELVTSTRRPVPLTWYFSTKHSLLPLLDEKGTHVNRRLSLNYLQMSASEARYRDDDDGRRGRRSRKRGGDTSYNSLVNISDYPLSKNEINKIRRSRVRSRLESTQRYCLSDLSYNKFHLKAIPQWVTSSLSMYDLKLVKCGIKMNIEEWEPVRTRLFYIVDLSKNDISGSPARFLNHADVLQEFQASGNKLRFDLGKLNFTKSLRILDLSRNLVYGKVPASVAGLRKLSLSQNNLCGKLPVTQFPASVFAGNDCLCGSPLPPCKT